MAVDRQKEDDFLGLIGAAVVSYDKFPAAFRLLKLSIGGQHVEQCLRPIVSRHQNGNHANLG